MRGYKKINMAFAGFIPREHIAEEFTRATRTQLGARPIPEVDTNITFQKDPIFSNRFMAQLNFRSCYEKKVMRIMEQNGGKVVQLREELHQRGQEETDNTTRGKEHQYENVNELISHRELLDMVDCFVLLNSGDFVLLNDGTSKVILNSCDSAVKGVTIQGQHATPLIGGFGARPKAQRREFELTAIGKITKKIFPSAKARLLRKAESHVKARLSRTVTESVVSKVTRLHELTGEGKPYTIIDQRAYQHGKKMQDQLRQEKLRAIKRLFEDYKDESDE